MNNQLQSAGGYSGGYGKNPNQGKRRKTSGQGGGHRGRGMVLDTFRGLYIFNKEFMSSPGSVFLQG